MNDSSAPALWPAPHPAVPVDATVRLPGSKSLTNRALVLAALSDGPSVVRQALRSRDTELMAAALTDLGASVDTTGDDWKVTPGPLRGRATVDCGLAGTVMRFVPPVAALADGPVVFDGDPHARLRPMGQILQGLRDLGVAVEDEDRGALPFTVLGTGRVRGGVVTIDASASSQFVSALLLAGARYDEGVDVRHDGKPVPSLPHIEMTVEQLRLHGVEVDDSDTNRWRVLPSAVRAVDVQVEPDLSNAAPFVAAALVTGGRVTVLGLAARDHAGRRRAARDRHADGRRRPTSATTGLTVTGAGHPARDRLRPARRRRAHAGGRGPVPAGRLARRTCAASRTSAATRPTGSPRWPPSSTRLGGHVTETEDGLTIRPAALHGGPFRTYADHRMAHAGGDPRASACDGVRRRGHRHHVQDVPRLRRCLDGAVLVSR